MSVTTTDRDLDKLEKNFGKQVKAWLKKCPQIFITEAWRSQERQDYLYSLGRTRPGQIVTWTRNSMHTKGLAVDVAFNLGSELYPADHRVWREIADEAKKLGIDWGFDLWGKDKPHFQDNEAEYEFPDDTYMLPQWAEPYINRAMDAGITTAMNSSFGELPVYQALGVVEKYVLQMKQDRLI